MGEANALLKQLNLTQDLDLPEQYPEAIRVAALCHDVGHGPFSHTFDDMFIQARL